MAEIRRQLTEKGQEKIVVSDPEYTISVIGLVASFCGQPLVGLILSILAIKQSHRADRHNTYALIGLIISAVMLGLWIIFMILYAAIFLFAFAQHGVRF